ncbi:MAG: TGS domain-containing protein [Acidimicrobiia bacterium]|nr:TGS domain-containing protein [Acidimicrobiia bacterium]NNL71372.1 TGS domain-containing protein [Acidimicrobiia bacterium]
MPANLNPEYRAAEAAFKKARDPQERLDHLREMLRVIPKHKGTDHLQADLKTRIKELNAELAGPRKGGARTAPPTFVHPEGAAQVALLGPPNTGKSALHDRLTGSHAAAEAYPFTTQYPQPGMFDVEDVSLQLVDLPPISPEHPVPWIANALQSADGCLFIVDVSRPGCAEETVEAIELLAERKVQLAPDWPADGQPDRADEDDPFTLWLPTVLVASKSDVVGHAREELVALEELTGLDCPVLSVSAVSGDGLVELGRWLFERLAIVRVYTKKPGGPVDDGKPYTVRRGDTVLDVARLVHRDIAASLKYARLVGGSGHQGQQVGRDHVVADGDVLELHS